MAIGKPEGPKKDAPSYAEINGTKPFDCGIPDFTAEQWSWLMERTKQYEEGHTPTRTLIDGL
ncbi:MAG TPA: hypothetical protein VFQ84_07575 [Arenimonas sp.]|uniref:hypothetical protein n=1 Tax=Arenimonas sp. TaxID=1872635 RepID=UPI002D7E8659|nr:hypothetical protein [Arenimonas sp.]HEU0153187.1 hypothetical protein [Arenimonas sp.]